MKFGIQYEQGEIIIVPFTFSNLSIIKQRPVLVLSKKEYNNKTEDIITCGITSNIKNELYSILIDNKNLTIGQIPVQSRIKVDKLFTVHQNIIRKKLGKLNEETFKKVIEELIKLVK